MAHKGVNTEHSGSKGASSYYGHRADAKADSRVKRRHNDRVASSAGVEEIKEQRPANDS